MRTIIGTLLLAILVIATIERNITWKDDGTLWVDTINKSPRKSRGYNELGLHAIQVRDYALALKAFTRSLELNPYLSNAYLNIGLAYEGLGQIDLAISTYEKAIVMEKDPIGYYNLGLVYYKKKHDHQKALELFLKARDLNPREPDVHLHLGNLYRDEGKIEQAEEEYRLNKMLK